MNSFPAIFVLKIEYYLVTELYRPRWTTKLLVDTDGVIAVPDQACHLAIRPQFENDLFAKIAVLANPPEDILFDPLQFGE